MVVDVDEQRTTDVVAYVESRGGAYARGIVCDLTDADTASRMSASVLDDFGHVDVLVNALGHTLAPASTFEATVPELWDDLYRANLRHVFLTTHTYLRASANEGGVAS